MKFLIKRTSDYSDKKPIKEAKKISVPYWHTRTCTEEYFDKSFSIREGTWRSKGKNHKKVNENCITRQEDNRDMWSVEINSLEELLKFEHKYGRLILEEYDNSDEEKFYELEIYDDYRE